LISSVLVVASSDERACSICR